MEYAKLATGELPWEEPIKDGDRFVVGAEELTRMDLLVPTTRGIMRLAAMGKLSGWQVAYLAHLEDSHQAGRAATMGTIDHGPEWNQLVVFGIIGPTPGSESPVANLVMRAADWNWEAINQAEPDDSE